MRYGVQNVFGSLPAVTLICDLLTPKSNQHIYESKYIFDQNWVKFPSLIIELWCPQGVQDAQIHALTD